MHFWTEAINTFCYTLNRFFLRPNTCQSSYELIRGKKSNVKHYCVFESTCYIIKDKDNLENFEAKSDLGIFLGDSNNSCAYKVYNLKMSTIMESINVLIDDFGVTKLDESKDNDVFGVYGSSKITTDNVEMLSTISLVNTL